MSWLRVVRSDGVRRIILDRPEVRNAIPADGWTDLSDAFADFEASEDRVLVLMGDGGAFCSGAELRADFLREVASPTVAARRMDEVSEVVSGLRRLTKPSIAAVDGAAVGAGMNLALACDLVIATSRARFAELFVRRGLTVDGGGTWLLPRIVGLQRAMELTLTGRTVEAAEAKEIGLCLEVVEPDELDERVDELAARLMEGAPLAQLFTKQAVARAWELSLDAALAWEAQSQVTCFQTEDFTEGVSAFSERRPPRFQGR
jgi:enoyl-CoA hydratase/carnithine racemase